jgi:CheY-like chemotaxis protein
MPRKVLVVDDNHLARKMVLEYLRVNGFEAADCDGPFGVMGKLAEFQPGLVLLDMMMPGLSGGSVADIIRRHITYGGTKIVCFSSIEEEKQREMVDGGLVDGYFQKCGSLNGLIDIIDNVLGDAGANEPVN